MRGWDTTREKRFGLGVTGPFFFHHIPKTGGTSFINLLRGAVPGGGLVTGPGNALSAAFTAKLATDALPADAVIHGHADWGACLPFRGRARFTTLLRDPRRHIVSHFQHALRDPAMPQHAAARGLGLRAFLRAYVYNIPFQTHALYRSITDPAEERRLALRDPGYGDALEMERYFASQHRAVVGFLDEMMAVGTLETIDQFVACLAGEMGWHSRPELPHDNRAAPAQRPDTASLLEQVAELECEPELAALFAIEQATYFKARSLALAATARRLRAEHTAGVGTMGDIVPVDNFQVDDAGNIWSGPRQLSRLRIGCGAPGAWRLILYADRLQGVTPAEVMLCCDGCWLDVEASETVSGGASFAAIAIGRGTEPYIDVWLYLQWNCYPAELPYYPAIRFSKIAVQRVEA